MSQEDKEKNAKILRNLRRNPDALEDNFTSYSIGNPKDVPQINPGNDIVDLALNNPMNLARAQAAVLHKQQIIKRVQKIQKVAHSNRMGDADIMGCSLSHIEEMCEAIINDYGEKEIEDDADA